jgi:threonine dehydratase
MAVQPVIRQRRAVSDLGGGPTTDGVLSAVTALKGIVVETPLIESADLNDRVGGRVLLKAESLQHGGSFKLRGALNRLLKLAPGERCTGVVAYSSGNHGIGVAIAAGLLGVPAVLVMPSDAPTTKLTRARNYGAEVVLYDRIKDSREAIAAAIAQDRHATVVPSFDDALIIEGQGTVAVETIAEASRRGIKIDLFLSPAGGGGLLAGCALAFSHVEPAGFDDIAQSISTGARVTNARLDGSLCDALLAPTPGELTWPILRRLVSSGLSVSDAEALEAIAFAWVTLKLVVEPSGAVALAALLAGKIPSAGKTIALVLSGGNVDVDVMVRAMTFTESLHKASRATVAAVGP